MRGVGSVERDEHGRQFDRLVFFSDAVFAIAITLLVLDLRLPPAIHGEVRFDGVQDKILGFGLSFAVIGLYWLSHHHLFGRLKAEDAIVRIVNLAFLASIAFLPFPTSVIAEYPSTTGPVRFYALSVALVGIMHAALTAVARRPSLLRAGETRGGTIRALIYTLAPPAVFLASALVAGSDPGLATTMWWLVIPALLAAGMIGRRVQARIDRPAAPAAAGGPVQE